MKIIQSFAQFEEGSPYLKNKNSKKQDYVFLNYYSFLLSYITIKEQHGSVTMFCNQCAYDSFIKYISYDEVIIKENDNNIIMWSKYKLDCMRTMDVDFIHVDSDVFIFNKLFQPFIDGDYDIIIQNILSRRLNTVKTFGFTQKKFLADTRILTKQYDGRCFSCGTLGLKKRVHEYYFAGVDVLYNTMLKAGLENIHNPAMLLEEQLLYYIAIENDFTTHEILSENLISEPEDVINKGDEIGYLHVWYRLKYKQSIIHQIRRKLYSDYPDYLDFVIKYENDVISKMKIFEHLVLEKSK